MKLNFNTETEEKAFNSLIGWINTEEFKHKNRIEIQLGEMEGYGIKIYPDGKMVFWGAGEGWSTEYDLKGIVA